jgi:hypothetical protein
MLNKEVEIVLEGLCSLETVFPRSYGRTCYYRNKHHRGAQLVKFLAKYIGWSSIGRSMVVVSLMLVLCEYRLLLVSLSQSLEPISCVYF